MFTPELPEDKPIWVSRSCPSECEDKVKWLEARVKELEDAMYSANEEFGRLYRLVTFGQDDPPR